MFGAPPSFKNTEKVLQIATFWPPQICIKSIFGRDSAPGPGPRWGDRAYDAPLTPNQVVRGQWYPVSSLSTLDVDVQSEFSHDFFKISPVCCPWQVPPGAARTPLATPLTNNNKKKNKNNVGSAWRPVSGSKNGANSDGRSIILIVCLRFSFAGDKRRFTYRHGDRIRDNCQLVLIQTADCRRWYPVTQRHCVIIWRRDDHEWPGLDSSGQWAS